MKKFLTLFILLTLLATGIFFALKYIPSFNKTQVQKNQNTSNKATITVEFDDVKLNFEKENPSGLSAFSFLQEIANANNLKIGFKQYDFGVFVEEIGVKKNTTDLSWIYFINGKSGEVAADKYEVKAGDLIEWKYIKPIY